MLIGLRPTNTPFLSSITGILNDTYKSVTQMAKSRYNSSAGRIAQLVRASLLHREGQGFESLCAHNTQPLRGGFCFKVRGPQ